MALIRVVVAALFLLNSVTFARFKPPLFHPEKEPILLTEGPRRFENKNQLHVKTEDKSDVLTYAKMMAFEENTDHILPGLPYPTDRVPILEKIASLRFEKKNQRLSKKEGPLSLGNKNQRLSKTKVLSHTILDGVHTAVTTRPVTTRPVTTRPTTTQASTSRPSTHPVTPDDVVVVTKAVTARPTTTQASSSSTRVLPRDDVVTTKDINISQICRDLNLENGIHAHPFECNKFIECTFLTTSVMDCPSGLVYDPRRETCQHPLAAPPCNTKGVRTVSKNGVSVTLTPPAQIDPKTLCARLGLTDDIYPHPSKCDKFIECSAGITYEMNCPSGLYYHRGKEACVDIHEVNCQNSVDFYRQFINA